jgi:hypothetical protein
MGAWPLPTGASLAVPSRAQVNLLGPCDRSFQTTPLTMSSAARPIARETPSPGAARHIGMGACNRPRVLQSCRSTPDVGCTEVCRVVPWSMLKKKSVGFSNTFVGMANWHEQVQSYIRKATEAAMYSCEQYGVPRFKANKEPASDALARVPRGKCLCPVHAGTHACAPRTGTHKVQSPHETEPWQVLPRTMVRARTRGPARPSPHLRQPRTSPRRKRPRPPIQIRTRIRTPVLSSPSGRTWRRPQRGHARSAWAEEPSPAWSAHDQRTNPSCGLERMQALMERHGDCAVNWKLM